MTAPPADTADLLLALHAAGDPGTAAWLVAALKADPARLARLLAGGDGGPRAVGEAAAAAEGCRVEEAAGRREGETWQGPSGRWFTLKAGRVVPAKNPKAAAPPKPDPRAAQAAAAAEVRKGLDDPTNHTPEGVKALAEKLKQLTVADLKAIQAERDARGGANKAARVERLLKAARERIGRGGGGGGTVPPPPPPRPEPPAPPPPPATPAPDPPAIDYRQDDPDHPVARAIAADADSRAVLEAVLAAHPAAAGGSFADSKTYAKRLAKEADRVWQRMTALSRKAGRRVLTPQADPEYFALRAEWEKKRAEAEAAEAGTLGRIAAARKTLLAALGTGRPADVSAVPHAGDPSLAAIFRQHGKEAAAARAERGYRPTDKEAKAIGRGTAFVAAACSHARVAVTTASSPDGRAYYNPKTRRLAIGTGSDDRETALAGETTLTESVVHELGHAIEHQKPGVQAACRAFIAYRCGGEPETDLGTIKGGKLMAGETGRKDNFDRHLSTVSAYYVGKIYRDRSGAELPDTEVLSMGLQALYRDPVGFIRDDPEYAQFVVSQLRRSS